MMTKRLCTAWTADPDEVRNAIRAMRRMARLGRMAERALTELRSKGSCGKAPVLYKLGTFGRAYNATVNMESLEPFQEVTRGEVPGYGEHHITFSDPIDDQGKVSIRIYLSGGQLLFRPNSTPVVRPIPDGSEVATVFLKKSADMVSVYPYDTSALGVGSGQNAKRAGRLLAKRVADLVVATADGGDTVRGNELQRCLADWLTEDGHAASWVRRIRDVASVMRTMSC